MPPTLSCFTNNYGPFGVRAAVEHIRLAGIEQLELALRGHDFGGLVIPESAVITERADDATVHAFLDLLERHGVSISGCNVGGGDMRTAEGAELTIRRLQFARKWFGVGVVVSGASQPGTPDEFAAVVRHLREVGDAAAENGVTVALETHQGPTQNAAAMLRLMEEVDHPNVLLNFDTGNIGYYNAGADAVAELRQVAGFVRNVHLKDNRGQAGDWYFPALGDGGAVDFGAIRGVLDAISYQGAYTIEIEGVAGEPEPGLPARHDRVRRSAEFLRFLGYGPPLPGSLQSRSSSS